MNSVDPLSDTVPPRHAYESDDEDELNPLTTGNQISDTEPEFSFKLIPETIKKGVPLLIASSLAGQAWGKGADLGEQIGGVYVNKIQVGMLFSPTWFEGTILVSEVTTKLPTWAMYPFVENTLKELTPNRVALLDSYPVPSYISQIPNPVQDAPIRYLSTGNPPQDKYMELFAPPNLLQTTSAAFITIASQPPHNTQDTTLLLLPAPSILPPPPTEVKPSNFDFLSQELPGSWTQALMQSVSKSLYDGLGVKVDGQAWEWHTDAEAEKAQKQAITQKRRGDIGEGGMYI